MFESIYVGSPAWTAIPSLNVISNNVANLNTPGFKGSQLQFADLYYKDSDAGPRRRDPLKQQIGAGVGTGGTFLNSSRATRGRPAATST